MNIKLKQKYIKADAICLTCGSTKENPVTAYCINDHDDWLELRDGADMFTKANKIFGLSTETIAHAIQTCNSEWSGPDPKHIRKLEKTKE